jgi:phospholipid-binding lipoprotein MlaA
VAAGGGLERHSEDFGQTLAVWGMGPGPYLVVPILGPSTVRDGAGLIVDTLIDPSTWLMWELALHERLSPTMAYTVSGHEAVMDEIAAVRKTSPDFYASLRDIYMQKRASEIADGVESLEPVPADPNR